MYLAYGNPLVTNRLSHPYHLNESIFTFRDIRGNFSFLFHCSTKIISANRIASDGMPRYAASHLRLFCLLMSHKKDARLIWVNGYQHLEILSEMFYNMSICSIFI